MFSRLVDTVTSSQLVSLEWLLAPILSIERPVVGLDDVFAPAWRSRVMALYAYETMTKIARACRFERAHAEQAGEVRCLLRDARDRQHEFLVTFESASSGRVTRMCLRPILTGAVVTRQPTIDDIAAMSRLEQNAPVRRDDGTEIVIDHNGNQFLQARVVSDHRWLAAFDGDRMLAVQGVALVTAPIGGVMSRIAYNHYSRSELETRQSGNLLHLIMTLYRDIFPEIDQFLSIVDVQNSAGLRLSFGDPWPTRVHRLFLPVAELARKQTELVRECSFDPERAASILNATHEGMNLWVERTASFLMEREKRAAEVYGSRCWRATEQAVLAIWPSGERRTYCKDGKATTRTLALMLDYGFFGERGREELTRLICHAARDLEPQGISHIAVFVSDGHPPTRWLMDLAEDVDTYAICAPNLENPAPADRPVYVDQIIF